MGSWWYSNKNMLNRTLQMQVHRAVKALKGEGTAGPPPAANPAAGAAMALLDLSGGAMNLGVLSNITNIPAAAASIIAASSTAARGGTIDNSPLMCLPSPLKETRQTSHQAQVIKTNTSQKPLLGLRPSFGTKDFVP